MLYNLNKILSSFLLAISLSIFAGCGGGTGINDQNSSNVYPEDNIEQTNDTKSPKLELIGGDLIRVDIGSIFTDPGSKAYDDVDGDLTSSILITPKTIDTSAKGEYEIVYTVSDKAGNIKSKTRKVIVRQKIESIPNDTGIIINELLAANASTNLDDDFKQFSDWIELYNSSDSEVDISGFYLSDDTSNPKKWKIPNGTKIDSHKYLIIWADKEDKKDKALHTNFKLSDDAESLTLANRAGNVIDFIEYGEQDGDISCAKVNNSIVYMQPTPKNINSRTYSELKHSKKPKFSLESGFYDSTQTLVLTQKNGGAIYYTTDGSIPTKSSIRYTQPITISETTVVRARAYEKDKLLSNIKNRTFFIDENITLPVVSIAINDKYLYDDKIGIYVVGTDDNGIEYQIPPNSTDWHSANFFHKWTRPAYIEYFKGKKSQFSENIGLRIAGAGSRLRPQKSFAIFAKDKYGSKSIKYKLFPDKPYIKKVKSFTLRNSGSDRVLLMRDALTHVMIKDNMDIDYQSYHPVIVFLNGNYWGIYNIREKLNEDYIEANHNINKKEIDMIGSREELLNGSDKDYKNIINFVKNHDMSNDSNYNHIISQIDLKEYLNYYITEIFVGNLDWPIQNIRYWKKSNGGKWRWMLSDTDSGYGSEKPFTDNTFFQVLDPNAFENGYIGTTAESTLLFRKLMENSTFKNQFISRFTTHLNLTFQQSRINSIIQSLKAPLIPEVERHFEMWGAKDPLISNYTFSHWNNNIDHFTKIQGNTRAEILRSYMQSYLGASGSNFLQIPLAAYGTIVVDGVKLTDDYSGKYFNNSKVTLKAIPNEGHSFIRWSNGNTNPEITVTLTDSISIQAEFN
jgi:hypothetical protein